MKKLFILFVIAAFFFSCQKELSFEGGAESTGLLQADLTGLCTPALVSGIYKADSLLGSGNYLDVEVNVITPGTYQIYSDTVNGYKFSGTGVFATAGIQTVRLFGNGTPLSEGTDVFIINFGTSQCQVSVNVVSQSTGFAVYTLGGAPGACAGFVVNGDYIQGQPLGISNSVSFTVDVTTPGLYAIGAASVNGMLFTSTGMFTATGVQQVALQGTGTPVNGGISDFTVTNLSSLCTFSITVTPQGGSTAVFTLGGSPAACTGATAAGVYTAATALDNSNLVTINVNVTNPGTYTITTNTVNGYSFSSIGTFTTTGAQAVILNGSGIPVAAGTDNFTVTGGGTTCTFSITVVGGAPPVNMDYIPQTAFSNWTYKLVGGNPDDTAHIRINPNTINLNSNTYRIFEYTDTGSPYDSAFNRKNGGMYYRIFDEDFGFDNLFTTDGLVLDSNLAVNANWVVNLGNNFIGGVPVTAKVAATILAKGATEVIESVTYNQIIKVKYTYSYNPGSGDIEFGQEEIWYAKGKGMVAYIYNDVPVTFTARLNATRVQVF